MNALVENNQFDVPEGMIENQLMHLKDNFSQRLKSQGMSLEMLGMDDENFGKTYREMAVQQVKGEILLDSIAELEGITSDDAEVEEKIKSIAVEANTPLETVEKHFSENLQARDGLKGQIVSDKVIELLLAKSTVTEVEPKQEETAGEES